MACASWSMAARPSARHGRLAGGEQHLGLEHEAVADDADVLAVAQQLAQAAEEVGAIALQLLHLPGEHDVEAGAEVGNARLALLVLGFRRLQRVVQGRDLPPQREQLLVEQVDLGGRLVGDRLLVLELLGERGDARILLAADPGEPRRRSLSPRSEDSDACSAESSSSSDLPLAFSRLSRLVSSAIWRVSRRSAVSLPLASWLT